MLSQTNLSLKRQIVQIFPLQNQLEKGSDKTLFDILFERYSNALGGNMVHIVLYIRW